MFYLVGVVCNGGHAPLKRGPKRESNRPIGWGRLEKRTPPMASMRRTQAEIQKWEPTLHEQRFQRSNGNNDILWLSRPPNLFFLFQLEQSALSFPAKMK